MLIIKNLIQILMIESFVMLHFEMSINIQVVFAEVIIFNVTISFGVLIKNVLNIVFLIVTLSFLSIEILESVVIYFTHENTTIFTNYNKIFSAIYNCLHTAKTIIA